MCKSLKKKLFIQKCLKGWLKVGNKCMKTEVVTNCQKGFKLVKGLCQKLDFYAFKCPPGWNKVGPNCQRKTEMCPTGFRKVKGKCIRVRLMGCKKGYKMTKYGCSKVVVLKILVRSTCPKGYKQTKTGCSKYAKALCPSDYKLTLTLNNVPCANKGGKLNIIGENKTRLFKCVKYGYKKAVHHKCPEGWKKNGNKCFLVKLAKCLKGYVRKGKVCKKVIIITKDPEFKVKCPRDYHLYNKKCVKTVVVQPKCPKGYKKVGKSCVKKVLITKVHKCKKGYKLNKAKTHCYKFHVVVKVCPKGAKVFDGKCIKHKIIRIGCKKGWKKVGKTCVKYVVKTLTCPKPFKLIGHKCVKVSPPLICKYGKYKVTGKCKPKCPKGKITGPCKPKIPTVVKKPCTEFVGMVLKKGKCVPKCTKNQRFLNGKCYANKILIPKIPKVKCLKGWVLAKNGRCRPLCPTGYVTKGMKCIKKLPMKCPKGFKRSHKICKKIITLPPVVSITVHCNKGWKLVNKHCIKTELPKCKKGYVRKGTYCELVIIVKICPKGYIKEKKNKCVKIVQLKCPKGWKKKAGKCEKVLPPVKLVCSEKGYYLKNGKCIKQFVVPATCPKGYHHVMRMLVVPCLKGKLGIIGAKRHHKVTRCEKKLSNPEIKCRKGFYKKGNNCFRRETRCPAGFFKRLNKCYLIHPKCKKGWVLSKNKKHCIIVCKKPLVRRGRNTCELIKKLICPKGTKKIGNKCLTVVIRKPTPIVHKTCLPGYKKQGTNCIKIAKPACKLPFKLVGKVCKRIIHIKLIHKCPKGYKRVGKVCLRVIKLNCPAGYKKILGGVCQKVIKTVRVKCPKGFKLQANNTCRKVEKVPAKCPQGFKPTYRIYSVPCKGSKLTVVGAREHKTKLRCVRIVTLTPKCPKGKFNKVTRKCEVKTCPKGFKKVGKNCVNVVIKPKPVVVVKCARGWKKNSKGICMPPKVVITCPKHYRKVNNKCYPPKIKCPLPSVMLKNKKCAIPCPPHTKRVGNNCVRIVSRKCPKGTIKKGKSCVKIVTLPPKPSPKPHCQKGYKLVNKKCVRILPPKCPKGYTRMRSGKCIRIIYPKLPKECPKGFKKLSNGVCKKIIIPKVPKVCPKGYKTLKNGNCLKVVVIIKCPKGFFRKGKKCEKIRIPRCPKGYHRVNKKVCKKTIVVVYIKCPKGSYLKGKKCFRKVVVPTKCPKGYSRKMKYLHVKCKSGALGIIGATELKKRYRCEKIFVKIPLVCPTGFIKTKDDKHCKRILCPAKTRRVNNKCVGYSIKCLPGFTKLRNGKCSLVCKKGTKKVGNKCLVILRPKCLPGFKRSGKYCKKVIPAPPKPVVCKKGWKKVGRTCVIIVIQKCPKGSIRVGKMCKTVVRVPKTLTCPKLFRKIGKQCIKIVKLVCKKNERKTKDGKCERIIVPEIKCPTGYKRSGRKCLKTEVLVVKCSPGFTFKLRVHTFPCKGAKLSIVGTESHKRSFVCEKVETEIKVVKCPKSYRKLKNGSCQKIICPVGFKLIKDRCLLIKKTCPKGFMIKNGKCFKPCAKGYKRHGRFCIKIRKLVCKKGYLMNKKTKKCTKIISYKIIELKIPKCKSGYKLVGNKCIKISLPRCPKGYKRKGSVCFRMIIKKLCPKGYTKKSDGICEKVMPPKCLKGWKRIAGSKIGKCEKILPPVKISCPKGSLLKGNKCIRIVVEIAKCPKGYIRKMRIITVKCKKGKLSVIGSTKQKKVFRCEKIVVKVTVCPTGFRKLRNGKCQRVVCPKGFILVGNKCNLIVRVLKPCPKGYRRVGKLCKKLVVFVYTPGRLECYRKKLWSLYDWTSKKGVLSDRYVSSTLEKGQSLCTEELSAKGFRSEIDNSD